MALKSRAAASGGMSAEHMPLLQMNATKTKRKEGYKRKVAFIAAIFCICVVIVCGILYWKSRQISRKYIVDCQAAPVTPEDRREDKSKLVLMNYNAEWLFLFGGSGGIKCPSDACPWPVFLC